MDGLWDIKTTFPNTQQPTLFEQYNINYIVQKKKIKHELAAYYHVVLCSPTISTLMMAIERGNLISWLGVNQLSFDNLLETTIATELEHLNQERKNLCSTNLAEINQNNYFPSKPNTKTNDIFTQCFHTSNEADSFK